MKIDVSIITINYNGLKDTCELIETIPSNDNLEVIVVDNASQNQEADIISQKFPHVKVIRSDKNLGFAGGNNLGIKAAQGRYLFLVNNDTIFKDFNIQSLINRAESSDKIGVVCPKIRFAWKPQPIQFAGYTELSMIIKREAIEKVGLMPECYFLYYEELDWSMMFTRADYQIWYEPKCTIYHKESQATGQNSPLRTYYITRNRLLLVRRNWDGLSKYLSYCYLTGLVAPRDILKFTFQGRIDLAKAVIKGICHCHSSIIN